MRFFKNDHYDGKIVGFENHSGRTYLGPGVKDGFEGAIYKNVYCSYSHGSLLPKNPALADHLISVALKQKYKDFVSLSGIDDEFENLAHDTTIKRIMG